MSKTEEPENVVQWDESSPTLTARVVGKSPLRAAPYDETAPERNRAIEATLHTPFERVDVGGSTDDLDAELTEHFAAMRAEAMEPTEADVTITPLPPTVDEFRPDDVRGIEAVNQDTSDPETAGFDVDAFVAANRAVPEHQPGMSGFDEKEAYSAVVAEKHGLNRDALVAAQDAAMNSTGGMFGEIGAAVAAYLEATGLKPKPAPDRLTISFSGPQGCGKGQMAELIEVLLFHAGVETTTVIDGEFSEVIVNSPTHASFKPDPERLTHVLSSLETILRPHRTISIDSMPISHLEPGLKTDVPFPVAGYEDLGRILVKAYDQSSSGKGRFRHANGLPWTEQSIFMISRMSGIGGLVYQVMKKAREAGDMANRGDFDAAMAEFLGAIVYAAAAFKHVEERKEKPSAGL